MTSSVQSGDGSNDGGTDPHRTHDPYGGCVDSCTHELARGVLVAELAARDGPFSPLGPFDKPLGPLAELITASR